MPCCPIVSKLCMLKMLLACVAGLSSGYDFGYHPSAEEFDTFLRDTSRTWTRDLLVNERRRAWAPFVPKYQPPQQVATWPGHGEKTHGHNEDRHDQQPSATNIYGGDNVASTLDFTMFSDERDPNIKGHGHFVGEIDFNLDQRPMHTERPVWVDSEMTSTAERPAAGVGSKPLPTLSGADEKVSVFSRPTKQTISSVLEVLASNSSEPSSSNQNYSVSNANYTNQSDAHFPIFFTNPATGIVYAITEVGQAQDNNTHSNDSIPIYITKEQYDRDLFLQRRYYEQKCNSAKPPNRISQSALSGLAKPSVRPQIIRLQKPTHTASKLPSAKVPASLHQPPPVMVETELGISDHVHVPPNRKRKTKKKKKKTKRPGRKPTAAVSPLRKPPIVNPTRTPDPYIVQGTHMMPVKPSASTQKLSTQLEKPSPTATIFSSRPFVSTKGYMKPVSGIQKASKSPKHRITRRSVANAGDERTEPSQTSQAPISDSRRSSTNISNALPALSPDTSRAIRSSRKLPTKRQRLPKVDNGSGNNKQGSRKNNRNRLLLLASSNRNRTTSRTYPHSTTSASAVVKIDSNLTSKVLHATTNEPTQRSSTKRKRKHKGSKRKKESGEGSAFDLFDLVGGNDDDDSDSYYYEYDEVESGAKRTKKPVFKTPKPESDEETTEEQESSENLKEDITAGNSSSADEDVDVGAMELDENEGTTAEYEIAETDHISSNTKSSSSKKRIRRRPSSATSTSYEDDYEDEEGGGVGGFFRMFFYPVQVLMGSMFDSFGDGDTDDANRPKYPTYTLYNNALQQDEEPEEEDEAHGNSFSSWLSSWLGYNRRTKKIGSTTAAPISTYATTAPPTEATGWFDSWFGKGTTTASYEDTTEEDDDDKWFFGWFDAKPKARRRTTTTTSTTTSMPQVPILTVVDPLRNPQSWIGILAHHLANTTSSTTHNPLIDVLMRATSTTTELPDVPRKIAYDKYQIWRLKPQSDEMVRVLEEYKRGNEGGKLHWLKGPSLRGTTDVLVPPKLLIDLQGTLSYEKIAYEVLIFDVGKAIAYEKNKEQYFAAAVQRPNKKNSVPIMSWHKYYGFDDILKYLESIRMRQPQIIELIHIGRSYEGRPLVIVKIESKEKTAAAAASSSANHKTLLSKKKQSGQANAVFIEAGTHGHEWIGPASSTWMISELLRIMKSNNTGAGVDFIKNTTWYVMPVLNPDGYVYSQEYDRFWRKSRSRHVHKPSDLITSAMTWLQQKKQREKVCYGVDLDRNWHFQWGSKRGSSKSACNEFYAGPVAFSEPETKALADFLADNRKQIKLYISMQAYGQVISYPLKGNASLHSERMDDLLDVAMVGIDGLRKKGSKTRYKIDSSSDLLENRAGCSDAFASYELGIPFAYTIQLADSGVHGHLLPSSSIETAARDAFEIVTAMLDYL